MKKLPTIVAFTSLILLSCGPQYEKTIRGNDIISSVPTDDVAMNLIIKNARETVDLFLAEQRLPKSDEKSFQVKYPFTTDPGSKETVEHIWLDSIKQVSGNEYSGIVQNAPFYIKSMKYGDTVHFLIDKISDWMYIKNGKIVGGKSIKLLIEDIPEAQRDEESKRVLSMF